MRLSRAWWLGALMMTLVACGDDAPPVDEVGPGEDAPQVVSEVALEAKAAATGFGRSVLDSFFAQGRDAALALSPAQGAEALAGTGLQLFVTIRVDGQDRGTGQSSVGVSFAQATREAVVAALEQADAPGGPLTAAEAAEARLEFNVLFNARALSERDADGLGARIEPGRHAFAIAKDGQRRLMRDTEYVQRGFEGEPQAFTLMCRELSLADDCFTDPALTIERFQAEHWIEDADAPNGFYELFRGHRYIDLSTVTREELRRHIDLNLDYLVKHQRPEGDFDYIYDMFTDTVDHGFSPVRQAGTSYAICKGAAHFPTPQREQACRNILDFFTTIETTSEAGAAHLMWNRDTSLGLTALALLAMAEFTATEDYKELAYRLADGITSLIDEQGRFQTDFLRDGSDSSQQFFPGEALLAMARMIARYGEPRWLEAVERAFTFYVPFWRQQGNSAFVPWQAATWAEIYFVTGDRKYADFAFELIDWSVERQNRFSYGDWAKDDFGGALTQTVTSLANFSTATHCEPISRVIAAARDLGEDARANRYIDRLRHGLRFSLQLIVTERETVYLPNPEASLGAVRQKLVHNTSRNDGVQHTVIALIHAVLYADAEGDLWGDEPLQQ